MAARAKSNLSKLNVLILNISTECVLATHQHKLAKEGASSLFCLLIGLKGRSDLSRWYSTNVRGRSASIDGSRWDLLASEVQGGVRGSL